MDRPKRIQRRRTKGWRKPPNTVYVGKGTPFGNKHDWRELGREEAVRRFKSDFLHDSLLQHLAMNRLKGKNLMCFCPLGERCHADVLLFFANQ